ncbi:hypothetical protein ACFZ8E_25675 [Methylobacterium sp. HMF5984]|uniref:hypothetical protein n=1 Tax=Methylobacterium sp. HMF5984 TaxID=3367370 RepID=UPI003852EECD
MNINITAPADSHARPQVGPVTAAISAMRAADLERSAFHVLRGSILAQIAADVACLDRLDEIGRRLALR